MKTDDLSSTFQTSKFQELLRKYEEMVNQQRSCYFESSELLQLAEYYAWKQQPEDSDEVIDYALSLHPDDLELQIYRCNSLIARGELGEAENQLNNILDQRDEEVIYTRATIYLERNEAEKANDLLAVLAQEEDNNTEVLTNIVNLFLDANNETYARKWLDVLFEHTDNEDIEALETASDFFFTFCHYQEAIKICNRLLDINPYEINYWLNLTRMHLAEDNLPKAFEAIDFALAINEKDAKSLELKGYCYMQAGNFEEAITQLKEALKTSETPTNLYQALETCYTLLGKADESSSCLRELLEDPMVSNSEKAIYHQRLAANLLAEGNYEASSEQILLGFECDKEYPMLYITMGELFLHLGEKSKAEIEFNHIETHYQLEPEEIKGQIMLAYFRAQYFEDAYQKFKQLKRLYPAEADRYNFCAAYCCYKLNDKKNLIKYLVRGNAHLAQGVRNNEEHLIEISERLNEDTEFISFSNEILELITSGNIQPQDFSDD